MTSVPCSHQLHAPAGSPPEEEEQEEEEQEEEEEEEKEEEEEEEVVQIDNTDNTQYLNGIITKYSRYGNHFIGAKGSCPVEQCLTDIIHEVDIKTCSIRNNTSEH